MIKFGNYQKFENRKYVNEHFMDDEILKRSIISFWMKEVSWQLTLKKNVTTAPGEVVKILKKK